jgi:hypothetical protein
MGENITLPITPITLPLPLKGERGFMLLGNITLYNTVISVTEGAEDYRGSCDAHWQFIRWNSVSSQGQQLYLQIPQTGATVDELKQALLTLHCHSSTIEAWTHKENAVTAISLLGRLESGRSSALRSAAMHIGLLTDWIATEKLWFKPQCETRKTFLS